MRFRLRTLILLSALATVLVGSIGRRCARVMRQRQTTDALVASGANLRMDWPGRSWIDRKLPWLPYTYVPVAAVQAGGTANFGDRDLESLKGIARELEVLELQGTAVTDTGLRALGGFAMSNLRSLDLSETAITDKGFVNLAECPGLTDIVLNGCSGITEKGIAKFRKRCDRFVRLHGTK